MQGRRGTLYHVESAAASEAHMADMDVRKKFASGKFLFSRAGILMLIAAVVLLIAAVLFLSTSGCPRAPSWYPWLYPVVTLLAVVITAAIFAFFVIGIAEDNPALWVKVALGIIVGEIVAVVTVSILTITNCASNDFIYDLPGIFGFIGAVLLAIGAAALFIMWQYRKEQSEIPLPPTISEQNAPRKSIFI